MTKATPKVTSFGWWILQNKILTRDNLLHQRVLAQNNSPCSYGRDMEETVNHLFLSYCLVFVIWYFNGWLEMHYVFLYYYRTCYSIS